MVTSVFQVSSYKQFFVSYLCLGLAGGAIPKHNLAIYFGQNQGHLSLSETGNCLLRVKQLHTGLLT